MLLYSSSLLVGYYLYELVHVGLGSDPTLVQYVHDLPLYPGNSHVSTFKMTKSKT